MKDESLPPFASAIESLLAEERASFEAPPESVRADLSGRLASLFPAPIVTPTAPPSMPLAAGGAASRALLAKGVGLLLLGAAGGSAVTYAVRTPAPPPEIRVVEHFIERPAVPVPLASPAPLAAPPIPPATAVDPVPVRPSGDVPPPAKRLDTDLGQERTLVETARAAVARRDGEAALAAIDEHQRRFANGRLGEEREALAVQALVLAGRLPEARARAARFRARYPDGLFAPVVDAAVGPP